MQAAGSAPSAAPADEAPAAHGNSDPSPAKQQQQQQVNEKKRKGQQQGKKADPKRQKMAKLFSTIAMNAKYNRLQQGMVDFEAAIQEEINLNLGLYNTMLYVACGGNNWEAYARGKEVPPNEPDDQGERPPLPSREELVSAAGRIWDQMQNAGVVPDNVTFMSLARIEAIKGDARAAHEYAKQCAAAGHPVQLRLYHPALVAYTLAGDADAVMTVDSEIAAYGKEQLDLSEYEYALLIEVLTKHGSWSKLTGVLHRVGRELNQLSPHSLALLEDFFRGPRAADAFGAASSAEREAVQQQEDAKLLQLRRCQTEQAAAQQREAELRRAEAAQRQQQRSGRRAATSPTQAAQALEAATAAAAASPSSSLGPGPEAAGEGRAAPAAPRQTGSPTAASSAPPSPLQPALPEALSEAELRQRRPWLGYPDKGRWHVEGGVRVDEQGWSDAAGARLAVVDLEEDEWAAFAVAVAELAIAQEARKSDFQHYMDWFERNGPYDILIDGANVAYYGQNRDGGGFNWGQIMAMFNLARRENPDKRVMLMLHKKRTMDDAARTPEVQSFLETLKQRRSFYYTPPGSNDDWYWLYATVKARSAGLLISNDELRDHIWNLLRPKHFLKWKSRHIAHYAFVPSSLGGFEPVLSKPPPFTECVQELENGCWMFPGQDGTWLCARPAAAN